MREDHPLAMHADESEPTFDRQTTIQDTCTSNVKNGKPPCAGLRVETIGELRWLLQTFGWSGEYSNWQVKYGQVPAGAPTARANLRGIDMTGVNLSGIHLCRADLHGAHLINTILCDSLLIDVNFSDAELGFANLSGAVLNSAILRGGHLREANLQGADLRFTDLSNARFAYASLKGANLRGAQMDASTVLAGIHLDTATQVRDISWNGVALTQVDWRQVPRLGDERVLSLRASGTPFGGGDRQSGRLEGVDPEYGRLGFLEAAVRANRQLSLALRAQGIYEHADRFAYRAQLLQRRVWLRSVRMMRWLGSLLLDLISGYGYKPLRSVITYILVILGFALAYVVVGDSVTPALSPLDALVFSVTSFHGRGFSPGETLTLHNPLSILAAAEAMLGLLIEITFIATFTQRFFAR
jgi:hypothetical protein